MAIIWRFEVEAFLFHRTSHVREPRLRSDRAKHRDDAERCNRPLRNPGAFGRYCARQQAVARCRAFWCALRKSLCSAVHSLLDAPSAYSTGPVEEERLAVPFPALAERADQKDRKST